MFIVYVIDLSTKNKISRRGVYIFFKIKIQQKKSFSFFISEIPNFFISLFFRKCSMFRRSISLKNISIIDRHGELFFEMQCSVLIRVLIKLVTISLLYLCSTSQCVFDMSQRLYIMFLSFLGDCIPVDWLWIGRCCFQFRVAFFWKFVGSLEGVSLQQDMVTAFRYKTYCTCLLKFTRNLSDYNAEHKIWKTKNQIYLNKHLMKLVAISPYYLLIFSVRNCNKSRLQSFS